VIFVLYNGLLEVFVPGSSLGEMVQVAQISPGQFFGEMSLLTGEPRSATIKAITRSSCFEISKQHILTILKERPEIGEIIETKEIRSA
jgi:CRP-like cAMP-binding protein